MSVDRLKMVAHIVAQGCERPLTRRFMRDVEPLFRAAEDCELRLADEVMLNASNVTQLLGAAIGEPVNELLVVSSKADKLHPSYVRKEQYDSFVSLALGKHRREQFIAQYGRPAYEALIDPFWEHLGRDYVATVQREYSEFLGVLEGGLADTVACGSMVATLYALAYAAHGDEPRYEEMRGLIRLLPWMIPIGSPKDSNGLWLVLAE